jgi:beta-lactamase class A
VTTTTERRRRGRHHTRPVGRHRGFDVVENFSAGFQSLAHLALDGAQVSARAVDLLTGRVLFSVDDHIVLPTASVGKVLLLLEVSAGLGANGYSRYDILERSDPDEVEDSGVWQHLHAPALPLADAATLIGATSDNLATNVLLRRVGLSAVRERAEELGLQRTALLDRARDRRGPDDAPQLSVGSMAELVWLFAAIARGEAVDATTSYRVADWLALGVDLSMVASAFGLDPLSHLRSDHNLALFNKTGTDRGLLSEVGVLRGPRAGVAYGVTIAYRDARLADRLSALHAMHTIGLDILEYVH